MKSRTSIFSLYRYQILPFHRHAQPDLFQKVITSEELIARKNEFFAEALESIAEFTFNRTATTTLTLISDNDFYLYRIGAERLIKREDKDFTPSTLDTWPSVYVAIWNKPDKQLVAIQRRTSAFQKTESVVRGIFENVSKKLIDKELAVHWEGLFEKNAFWDLVKENKGKITSVKFKFITPNMANISGSMTDVVKDLAKTTNSTKNELGIEANDNSSLVLDESNETINGLVDYTSEGGGDISIKIASIKKTIHTSRSIKSFEIENFEGSGKPEEIAKSLKSIMS